MDGTVKLWNVNDGKLIITLEGPSEAIEVKFWSNKIDKVDSGLNGIQKVM
jgi:WD40 repeat protein